MAFLIPDSNRKRDQGRCIALDMECILRKGAGVVSEGERRHYFGGAPRVRLLLRILGSGRSLLQRGASGAEIPRRAWSVVR